MHCGPSHMIKGRLAIRFVPSKKSTTELFGPLQASVQLEGRAKTKKSHAEEDNESTNRGRAPLVRLGTNVHDGPVRVQAGHYTLLPFDVRLPESVQLPKEQPGWKDDADFDSSPSAPLPPSMRFSYQTSKVRFECFVEYRLTAKVSMSQIDIKTKPQQPFDPAGEMIFYQPYRLSPIFSGRLDTTPLNLRQQVEISNKHLLPEHLRPTSITQRARGFFDDSVYPSFVYAIALDGPQEIHANQSISFVLSLRPNIEKTTAPELPSLCVVSFQVHLKKHVKVRVQGPDERHEIATELIRQCEASTDRNEFSKATDYTRIFTTPIFWGVKSSFSTYNILQTYTLEIVVSVEAAKKVRKFQKEYKVKVLPPLTYANGHLSAADTPRAIAGPSGSQAGPSNAVEPLPEYQPPPSYEQVDKQLD